MSKYCIVKEGEALYTECNECSKKLCTYFFCLVVGSRDFNDYDFVKRKLDHILKNHFDKVVIVSGGAKGADSCAERYAAEKGYECVVFHAEWDKYGKVAGYIRNKKMHEYIAKAQHRGCVAFWKNKSKGTSHNFDLAKEFNTPIRIIKV